MSNELDNVFNIETSETIIEDIKEDNTNLDFSELLEQEDSNKQTSVKVVNEPKKPGKKGKKSKVEEYEEDTTVYDSLQDEFNTYLGKTQEITVNDKPRLIIPTGLQIFDALTGGGLPTSLIQLVGNPGSSKSTLAAKVLSEGQRRFGAKFLCKYFDAEQSTSDDRLADLGVLNPRIVPYDENVTVEKVLKAVEGMALFKEKHPELLDTPSIIIWDSIANTLTEKGFVADSPDSILGEKARVLSSALPRITDKLNKYNICLLAVNQLRDKIDIGIFKTANDLKYLGNNTLPGGKSLLFNSFQLFMLKAGKEIDEYGFKGNIIEVKAVKNKMFTPNIPFKLVMSFQRGFSNFWSNYELLKETNRVKPGAWCTLINLPEVKFRQCDAIGKYREDSKFKEAWDEMVKDAIQVEILEKYTSTTSEDIDVFE